MKRERVVGIYTDVDRFIPFFCFFFKSGDGVGMGSDGRLIRAMSNDMFMILWIRGDESE